MNIYDISNDETKWCRECGMHRTQPEHQPVTIARELHRQYETRCPVCADKLDGQTYRLEKVEIPPAHPHYGTSSFTYAGAAARPYGGSGS